MRISAVPILFLASTIYVPASAQQSGTAAATAPALSPAETQRITDENVARTYMATKRYREARDVYERLAKASPREPSYLNLAGIASMQMGDLRGARQWFERCIKLQPRYADAYNNLGATWYTEKNFKRALEYYQRAVLLLPGVASYHTNVGFAYFSLDRVVEAEEAFRRAILMDPFIFQQNDRTGTVLQDRSVDDKGLFAFTMAKSFAGAGEAMLAARYLRRALDEGYKDIQQVYTDPSFTLVLEDPEVQAVLTLISAARPSEAALPQ
jgi:tetratricopeptide (TPR) repeat protein